MAKLLIHFISDFIRDKNLRCAVLENEIQGPLDYGLSKDQVDILNTYDPDRIWCEMYTELLAAGIDVVRKKKENGGDTDPPPTDPPDCDQISQVTMMVASAYQAGNIHGRKLQPAQIPGNSAQQVTILGNGFDPAAIEVRFKKGGTTGDAVLLATSCDIDLYQRVIVSVTLTAGTWRAEFRNGSNQSWTEGDRALDLVVT